MVSTTEASTAGTLTLYWPWKRPQRQRQGPLVGALGQDQRQQEAVPDGQRRCRCVTVTSAGRVSGNASRHSMPHSVAPSTRIDSNSSLGTSRMKLVSTSTDSGMANAIDGRMIASRLSYRLQPDDHQVDRDDRRLQRDRQAHQEQRR